MSETGWPRLAWTARARRRSRLAATVGGVLTAVPPPAQVLTGIVSVQIGAALAKQLFGTVGSTGAVALRISFAAIVLLVFWRPSVRLAPGTTAVVIAYGVVLGAMNLCFYLALERIPLGVAVTIEFLGPLAVAIGGSRRWLDGVWAALAAGGVVLLAESGAGEVQLLGILLALATAVLWASYILLSAALGRRTVDGGGLALGMAVATLVVAPTGLLTHGSALFEPWVLAVGFGVALLSSVIPYSLELEALRRIPANVFGVLMSLEPAVAALAGFVVLGQTLGARELVAIAIVIAASVGVTRTTVAPPVDA
jgi:inner membrane transporter RhtA